MKNAFIFVFFISLSSCVHSNKVKMTGCDHPSGWSDQIRSMSSGSYIYAQLSVNAYYDDSDPFQMSDDWTKLESYSNNINGMSYDVWKRNYHGGEEIVLSFRGTEFSHFNDWKDGNFGTKQNADGLIAFDKWKSKYPNAQFSVTGHSLGGGIATQISLSRENVRSFIFNSSPRFKAPDSPADNPRVSVVEYGEILKVVRIPGREATQDYFSIGCRGGNPIGQHDSKSLAVCLTQIASWDNEGAARSLALNSIASPVAVDPPGYADCRKRRR